MTRKALMLLPAAACALLLAGCSSSDSDDASTTAGQDSSDLTCPTAPAPDDTAAQWTLDGNTGKVEVAAATQDHGPLIRVTTPFAISETQVKTLEEGSGTEVAATDTVFVCYQGVNGRTGQVFDSSYERGTATDFPVNGVVPGFQKALIGQKAGSSVAVAMTPDDGYGPNGGNPTAGINADDTLVFELKIAKIGE